VGRVLRTSDALTACGPDAWHHPRPPRAQAWCRSCVSVAAAQSRRFRPPAVPERGRHGGSSWRLAWGLPSIRHAGVAALLTVDTRRADRIPFFEPGFGVRGCRRARRIRLPRAHAHQGRRGRFRGVPPSSLFFPPELTANKKPFRPFAPSCQPSPSPPRPARSANFSAGGWSPRWHPLCPSGRWSGCSVGVRSRYLAAALRTVHFSDFAAAIRSIETTAPWGGHRGG